MKGRDGKLIEVLNLDEQMDLFDVRLRRPLNYDQVREAVLREVAAS